jgi:hypothetical protein
MDTNASLNLAIMTILYGSAIALVVIGLAFIFLPTKDDNKLKKLSKRVDIEELIEKIVMEHYYNHPMISKNRDIYNENMKDLGRENG